MHKVLFVCHGNICRSPMGQYVLQDMVNKAGLSEQFHIASVAVSREELGHPVYPPAKRELNRHGINCDGKYARRITAEDFKIYDRIYYMDSSNARYLKQLFPKETKYESFLPRNVADPWYTGDFTQTWADICEGCEIIIRKLREHTL